MTIDELLDSRPNSSAKDAELIRRAFAFSEESHKGKKRFSGEPVFLHACNVAKILASIHMDASSIAAGLLHDTTIDGSASIQDIRREFGKDIASMVEGVTSLSGLKYRGAKQHAEGLRRFFVYVARDIRTLIIKCAERLDNMRTLDSVPKDKRTRIALEALEIYAPLANRLGLSHIKGELEDLAFPYVFPKEYAETKKLLAKRVPEGKRRLKKMQRTIQKHLASEGITIAHIDARVKHLFSFYKKLVRHNGEVDKIYDIVALRIIVNRVDECYRILGIIHSMWQPIPGTIKDYIATPKANGYQSLHTAITTRDGARTEIQIRTREMHDAAELGVASHIGYVESDKPKQGGMLPKHLRWVEELLHWRAEHLEFAENNAEQKPLELFKNSIFVFTPEEDVIELPKGSTPIDFAFAVHTDLGMHAMGAKVRGKLVALETPLQSSDVVEIITKPSAHPSAKWLDFVVTSKAKHKIRVSLKKN